MGRLRQHHDWSGKNCPRILRDAGRWGEFVRMVQNQKEEETGMNVEQAKEILRTKVALEEQSITFLSLYKYGGELMIKLAQAIG